MTGVLNVGIIQYHGKNRCGSTRSRIDRLTRVQRVHLSKESSQRRVIESVTGTRV